MFSKIGGSIDVSNSGSKRLDGGVAVLGQVFLKGEVPAGGGLVAVVDGRPVAVQLDVKTRYEDGSVKMAVLSVERPALAPGQSVAVELQAVAAPAAAAPAIDLASALAGHSFVADLSLVGGPTYHVDVLAELARALSAGTASFWQQGELASEARVEVMLAGSQRLVFDVTAFKGGGLKVDAQFNNDRAMEAVGGAVTYDLRVSLDGRTVMQETVSQAQYQNVQRSFSTTDHDGGHGLGDASQGWLNIRHDVEHLQDAGAVANYDLGLVVSEQQLAGYGTAIASPGWGGTLATNGVTQGMPMTGGRADIGFTTLHNTNWLISQDVRAAEYALGQAQTSGAVPWNMWNAQAGTWLNDEAYPELWLDGRGGTGRPGDPSSGGLTQQVAGTEVTGWEPDTAHQPALTFVPYLLTGERWVLDNLQAHASWNVLRAWPGYDKRGETNDIVVNGDQVRAGAWSLRQIDDAAWASPDGSAAKAYFQQASLNNWAWLVSKIPEWTAQQGEAHGWVPSDYSGPEIRPWMQDFFASTAISAAKRGVADALTFLKWQENFLVGRFLHEADGFNPRDGIAYVVASADPATGRIFQTWREMGEQSIARDVSNLDGWNQSHGYYGQLGLASLAGIHELTGSPQAKAAYDWLLSKNPPGTSGTTRDPTFALDAPSNTQNFTIQEVTGKITFIPKYDAIPVVSKPALPTEVGRSDSKDPDETAMPVKYLLLGDPNLPALKPIPDVVQGVLGPDVFGMFLDDPNVGGGRGGVAGSDLDVADLSALPPTPVFYGFQDAFF